MHYKHLLIIPIILFILFACGGTKNQDISNEKTESVIKQQDSDSLPVHSEKEKIEEDKPEIDKESKDDENHTKQEIVEEDENHQNSASKKNELGESETEREPSKSASSNELVEEKKPDNNVEKTEVIQSNKPNHALWNALLQKYVSVNGKVNYKGLRAEKSQLQAYLTELDTHPIQTAWSRDEKLAYWINAYNAFTIKLILDHYPLNSITNLHRGKPWDVKWIKLGGKTYSLNNIENDVIRPQFKDGRIHFAVNCAAKSCPPLLNKAWTAQNIQYQLDLQARNFINNTGFNKISTGEIEISKIFEWYASDFGPSIINYLNKYASTKISSKAKVTYREYNWGLNE